MSGGSDGGDIPLPPSPELSALLAAHGAAEVAALPPALLSSVAAGVTSPAALGRLLRLSAGGGLLSRASRRWPGLASRLAANPSLPRVMAVELGVGGGTKLLAEIRQRGDAFWAEADFVASDLALELVGDALLVWLLSPALPLGAAATAGGGGAARVAAALGRLPRHAGAIGAYTLPQRLGAGVWKGAQFAGIGLVSSAVGHSATKALVAARGSSLSTVGDGGGGAAAATSGGDDKHLASVWDNSVAWGAFLGLSSNPRYQLVSALEARVVDGWLPKVLGGGARAEAAAAFASTVLRLGNCYTGSSQWIPFARMVGVQ